MALVLNGSGITSANIADGTITTDDILASDVKNLKSGRKNLIINGGFDVWQRGVYTTATTIVNAAVTADRWRFNSTVAGTIQDLQDGVVRLEATAAGTGTIRKYQNIEDRGLYRHISSKTVTFSAWVKSNTPNARIELYQSAWNGFDASHSGGGDWEYLSVTQTLVDISAIPDGHLMTQIGLDGFDSANVAIAIGDYIEFKEVQLELGSVATDFEHRSYGEELALCQRYYQKSYPKDKYAADSSGFATEAFRSENSSNFMHCITYHVPMRVIPTKTYYSPQGVAGRAYGYDSLSAEVTIAAWNYTEAKDIPLIQTGTNEGVWFGFNWVADAEL